MKTLVPASKPKLTTKAPLDSYLKRKSEIEAKTVRAPEQLWVRLEKLAEQKGESVNHVVVCALEKVCDEEGV
jgi:hypothetical protein